MVSSYADSSRIPFDRALHFANKERVTETLHPLFDDDIRAFAFSSPQHGEARQPDFNASRPPSIPSPVLEGTADLSRMSNPTVYNSDSITASPILAKHLLTSPYKPADALRALDPVSTLQGSSSNSIHSERLPSFRQLTSSLPAHPAAFGHAAHVQQADRSHHSQSSMSANPNSLFESPVGEFARLLRHNSANRHAKAAER